MAQLVYDKTGRLLFTKEMKKEYTLLVPQMLPMHFALLVRVLQTMDYKVEMLNTSGKSILDYGQKYVHNDACFPAILVIGQLIDAVKSGKYDPAWALIDPNAITSADEYRKCLIAQLMQGKTSFSLRTVKSGAYGGSACVYAYPVGFAFMSGGYNSSTNTYDYTVEYW